MFVGMNQQMIYDVLSILMCSYLLCPFPILSYTSMPIFLSQSLGPGPTTDKTDGPSIGNGPCMIMSCHNGKMSRNQCLVIIKLIKIIYNLIFFNHSKINVHKIIIACNPFILSQDQGKSDRYPAVLICWALMTCPSLSRFSVLNIMLRNWQCENLV